MTPEQEAALTRAWLAIPLVIRSEIDWFSYRCGWFAAISQLEPQDHE